MTGFLLLSLFGIVSGKIYFQENFDDDSWRERWITPNQSEQRQGKFKRYELAYTQNKKTVTRSSLITTENNKEYALSTTFLEFSYIDTNLIFQYSAKYVTSVCAYRHIRLFNCDFKPSSLNWNTAYFLSLGPDICEYKSVSVAFHVRGQNQPITNTIEWEADTLTHVYTLTINPDRSYQVLLDGQQVLLGNVSCSADFNDNKLSETNNECTRICGVGILQYHHRRGSTFDDILITDDANLAENNRQEIIEWMKFEKSDAKLGKKTKEVKSVVVIESQDLVQILQHKGHVQRKDGDHNESFINEFPEFLVAFDWNGNNTAIKAVAEYNKINFEENSENSLRLWVSFQPRSPDITEEAESVIATVKEANAIYPDTVSTLVINYGLLVLDKQSLSVVNHEIRKVKNMLSLLGYAAPKLGLELDQTNCRTKMENIEGLDRNLIDVVILMQQSKEAVLKSGVDRFTIARFCKNYLLLLREKSLVAWHIYIAIQVDLETGTYQYDTSIFNYYEDECVAALFHVDGIRNRTTPNVLITTPGLPTNWYYQPNSLDRAHFGALISSKENGQGMKNYLALVYSNFRHILVNNTKDSFGESNLNKIVHGLMIERGITKIDNNNNQQLDISLLLSIDYKSVQDNRQKMDEIISVAAAANKISPKVVKTIFIDWLPCRCSGMGNQSHQQNFLNCNAADKSYFSKFTAHVNTTITKELSQMDSSNSSVSDITIGTVLDENFLRAYLVAGYHVVQCWSIAAFYNSAAFLCKTTLSHVDLINFGWFRTFNTAIENFALCKFYIGGKDERPVYFLAHVTGCDVGGNSNITQLTEYARLMEYLNQWAITEGHVLFVNGATEDSERCNNGKDCDCGWWIKTNESTGGNVSDATFEEKKIVARLLFEKSKYSQKPSLPAVSTQTLLWIFVPLFAFLLIVTVLAIFFIIHYRAKHMLTKQEVEEFVKGKQSTTATASGDENATSQSYDSDKFELKPSSFTIDITSDCLGSGEYARVYRGSIRRDGVVTEAAVKLANSRVMGKSHGYYLALKSLLSEIKILAYVGEHNHVVALLGAYTKNLRKGEIAVFLELCQLGCLEKYLHTIKPQILGDDEDEEDNDCSSNSAISSTGSINKEKNAAKIYVLDKESSDQLYKWAGEIATGMEFLTSKKLVHGDLATRNVLLTAEKVARISDFGMSRRLYDYTEYVKRNQAPLPWRWMAPESLCRMVFNEKTDVWAFGVTLWEMFTLGDQPYPGLSWSVDFPSMLERGMRLHEPRYNLNQIYKVMLQCWDISQASRPTFAGLKSELYNV